VGGPFDKKNEEMKEKRGKVKRKEVLVKINNIKKLND
jgi:hypothetical protein